MATQFISVFEDTKDLKCSLLRIATYILKRGIMPVSIRALMLSGVMSFSY